jgi:hypothetical protein
MVIISLYKTINSFVQKNDLFCTKENNLLYKIFLISLFVSKKHSESLKND